MDDVVEAMAGTLAGCKCSFKLRSPFEFAMIDPSDLEYLTQDLIIEINAWVVCPVGAIFCL